MHAPAKALALSQPLLRGLIVLNLLYAVGIGLLFTASLFAADVVFDALGVTQGPHRATLLLGMRAMMVAGVLGAVVVDRVLRHLLAMVDSVRAGDLRFAVAGMPDDVPVGKVGNDAINTQF